MKTRLKISRHTYQKTSLSENIQPQDRAKFRKLNANASVLL